MADVNSMQGLLKLHQEVADRLSRRLESIRRKPDYETMVADEAAAVAQAKDALAHAVKERDAAVQYWDDRIERLRARVDRQQDALKHTKAQFKEAAARKTKTESKPEGAGPAKKSRRAAPPK